VVCHNDACVPHILVVDDDPGIVVLLQRILTAAGYEVERATNGKDALARVAVRRPDLVVLDLDMPEMGGYEVCRQLKDDPRTRLMPILILTGRDASPDRVRAWDLGADEFLTKPFQVYEVQARCRALLRVKRLVDEMETASAVVIAFARAVEAKCPFTLGHAERVTEYAMQLAHHLGLSQAQCEVLHWGGLLHDIGKIAIPDAVLNKPGRLTTAEFELVKQHPLQGVRIVEPLRSLRDTLPLIRWHHERLDGRGYPDGLFGGAIPLDVRILAVADVYDALSSARPYRAALAPAACLEMLHQSAADGGLDPQLVMCFAELCMGRALVVN
jgi:putative two-component system response regulator